MEEQEISQPIKRANPVKRRKAQRKPAGPRAVPLTFRQRFDALSMIVCASHDEPDATLAKRVSATLPRQIAPSTVTNWRRQLGLEAVKEPSRAQLKERIAQLEAQLMAPGVA